MKLKILSLFILLLLFVQSATAAPFQADARTKRIPAGTKFTLKFLNPISSTAGQGADFSAIMLNDQTAESDVILPSGSVVRGSVNRIIPAKRFSKGAIVYLDFDHVVTPNGRQVPLTLAVVGRTDLTNDGGITTTRGYWDAVKQNWVRTKEITHNSIEWADDTFDDLANGTVRYIMIPLSAIGGGIGGGAYFVYDGIADMIRKGKDVNLMTGEVMDVILVEPIDVPVI